MYIGMDHTPTNVIKGMQCATHRISIDVDINQPDNVLRHIIYTQNMPRDVFRIYPHGGVSLKEFLDSCEFLDVVPLVNLNFGRRIWDVDKRPSRWKSKYTYAQWQRLSRLVVEIINQQYSFSEQYLQVFNEPLKWLDRHETGLYTRATNHGIGGHRNNLPIVIGNEEWDLASAKGNAYHYWCVHFAQDFDYIGAHPLSSIMNNAYWKIRAWKELADQYGKKIMATEAGAWELNYTSPAGHERNKKIILECKKYGYRLCNIVLVDSNDSYFPRLGYRGWDKYYTRIVSVPSMGSVTYFQDFLNFIKVHGHKEQEPIEEEIEDMKLYLLRRGVEGNFVQWLQEILDIEYGFENDFHNPYDGKFGPATETQVREYQTANGLQVDGIVGKETTTALINNAESPSKWMNQLKVYTGFEN